MTSTKQFVWTPKYKKKPAEFRDATGSVQKQYFGAGELNLTAKRFFSIDHLSSIRELTDQSGAVLAQYVYDPYGQLSKVAEIEAPDFAYCGYYSHWRSGLYETRFRMYQPKNSIWLSRDPVMNGSVYRYVDNSPILYKDSLGLYRDYGKDIHDAGKYTVDAGTRVKNRIEEIIKDMKDAGFDGAAEASSEAAAAAADAENSGLDGAHNGQQDAYRHCLWACYMGSNPKLGAAKAAKILATHEEQGGGPSDENAMDACNNDAGICASQDPKKDDPDPHKNCQKKCMKKLKDGKLCVMDK